MRRMPGGCRATESELTGPAQKQNAGFPIYAVAGHEKNDVVLVGGGGGKMKSGLRNLLVRPESDAGDVRACA